MLRSSANQFRQFSGRVARGTNRHLERTLGGPERKRVIVTLACVLAMSSADAATVGAAAAPLRAALHIDNTDIGLLVTGLFLGRLVYRYIVIFAAGPAASLQGPPANPMAAYQNNPWTAAIFGLLFAYYILYYLGILRKTRTLSQQPA